MSMATTHKNKDRRLPDPGIVQKGMAAALPNGALNHCGGWQQVVFQIHKGQMEGLRLIVTDWTRCMIPINKVLAAIERFRLLRKNSRPAQDASQFSAIAR